MSLNFYLLIKHAKCDILEICDRWDFIVEYYFLCYYIYEIAWLLILDPFALNLVWDSLGKRKFIIFAQSAIVSSVIFGKDTVYLTIIQFLNGIHKLYRLKLLILDLLNKRTFDNKGRLLQVDIPQKMVFGFNLRVTISI